jgi:RES domain-containing protein
MLTFWRICTARRAASAFDGEGARIYGGRWNSKGVAMVYCSSSLSLATLESFVHFSSLTVPSVPQVSFRVSLPDSVPVERFNHTKLPANWRDNPGPTELQDFGDEWATSLRTVAMLVSSAVTPIEDNVLLNPRHPDMAQVITAPAEPSRTTYGCSNEAAGVAS